METEVLVKNCQREPVDRRRLIAAAKKSLEIEGFGRRAEISIMLVDDEHIRSLNVEYRGNDRPTDVLAFSQLEGKLADAEREPVAVGDVVVSVETAKRQAVERARPLADELDLLVVHGVLHLLGYDDETKAGATEMRQREQAILDVLEDGRRV